MNLAETIIFNYHTLPSEVSNLLLILVKNDYTAKSVNKLLLTLADNNDAAGDVAHVVVHDFDQLPKDVQNLLFKLADNNDAAGDVARAVAHDFDQLAQRCTEFVV